MTEKQYKRFYYLNNRDRILEAASEKYHSDKNPIVKPNRRWDEAEEARLIQLKQMGYKWREIGEELKRHPKACQSKYFKLIARTI